jgi:hypothetical protein
MSIPMIPVPGGGPDGGVLAAPPARRRPGRIWYLVPLVVFLAGVAWLVVGLLSVGSHVDSFPRVPIPAGGQVSLNHPGGYVVYYEGPGAQSGDIPAFNVRVIPASASAAVRSLRPYAGSVTYGIGSHQGRAVLTLQVSKPGLFRIEASGTGSLPAGADLAFGNSIAGGIVATVLPSVLLILAGLAGLVVLFVIRIVQASRARSAAAGRPGAAGWPPPGPQP